MRTTHRHARARPPPRRRLLVHGRSRLGDRHVVRHRRPARQRRHERRRRGRLRRRALVPHPRGTAGERLVHGADRDPDADEGGRRGRRMRHDLPSLRFIASVGRAARTRRRCCWGEDAFGLPIHDNWWQTETGGIMIANFAAMDISPARWAGRCRASRRRSCDATSTGTWSMRERRARVVEEPMSRANWRCGRAGRRCSAATSTRTSATASASPAAGT